MIKGKKGNLKREKERAYQGFCFCSCLGPEKKVSLRLVHANHIKIKMRYVKFVFGESYNFFNKL